MVNDRCWEQRCTVHESFKREILQIRVVEPAAFSAGSARGCAEHLSLCSGSSQGSDGYLNKFAVTNGTYLPQYGHSGTSLKTPEIVGAAPSPTNFVNNRYGEVHHMKVASVIR